MCEDRCRRRRIRGSDAAKHMSLTGSNRNRHRRELQFRRFGSVHLRIRWTATCPRPTRPAEGPCLHRGRRKQVKALPVRPPPQYVFVNLVSSTAARVLWVRTHLQKKRNRASHSPVPPAVPMEGVDPELAWLAGLQALVHVPAAVMIGTALSGERNLISSSPPAVRRQSHEERGLLPR